MSPTPASQPVAIVTGASRGIGAGVVDVFRAAGYAVVGTARSMPSSDDPDFLTVDGDLAQAQTAQRVVEQTLDRFGRIDTLVNMAGIFVSKPFTDYTVEDYAMAMWPCCGDAASDRDPLLHASRCDMARGKTPIACLRQEHGPLDFEPSPS